MGIHDEIAAREYAQAVADAAAAQQKKFDTIPEQVSQAKREEKGMAFDNQKLIDAAQALDRELERYEMLRKHEGELQREHAKAKDETWKQRCKVDDARGALLRAAGDTYEFDMEKLVKTCVGSAMS